jgi:plasmid stabilization system protein ParE
VIPFSRHAEWQLSSLYRHYEELDRLDAVRNLTAALRQVCEAIERDPAVGLAAPRPYPQLARPGRAWVKAGRYWVAYRTTPRLLITGIFYETANIPDRVK